MKKLFKILLCSLSLFFIFLSHNSFLFATEYTECVVTKSSNSGRYSLKWYLGTELASSAASCLPSFSTIDSEFNQVVLIASNELDFEDDIAADGITLESALSINVGQSTDSKVQMNILGNWNYYSVTDGYSQLDYDDSYAEYFTYDDEPYNWGTTIINAREVEGAILNCSGTSSEDDLYIRNTIFLVSQSGTTAPTTDIINDDCDGVIYNAGYTWICNKTSVPSNPSSDSYCRAINNLAAAATEEEVDGDGDGYTSDEDCDDTDATINPDATEVCDDVDNDCDDQIDERLSNCEEETDVEDTAVLCEDGTDNDSDTYIDSDDSDCAEFYDGDGDGYCSNDVECTGALTEGDCDDADPTISPIDGEICDEIDNNCDGEVDEEDASTGESCEDSCYDENGDADCTLCPELDECATAEDADGDGYTTEDDCDDTDATINPGADEVCDDTDEVDEDCDGDSNDDDSDCSSDGDDDIDDDGDTFTENEGDCDDDPITGVDVYPGATEIYNQIDDDCNDTIDDGFAGDPTVDDDLDGYCEDADACTDGMDPGDCDDTDDTVSPAADEICEDSIDNNCDGFDVVDDSETLALKTSALSKYQYNSKISAMETVNASESGLSCIISDLPSSGSGGCGCDILGARQGNPVNSVVLMILLGLPVGLVFVVRRSLIVDRG